MGGIPITVAPMAIRGFMPQQPLLAFSLFSCNSSGREVGENLSLDLRTPRHPTGGLFLPAMMPNQTTLLN
jgi:hypothetical protein